MGQPKLIHHPSIPTSRKSGEKWGTLVSVAIFNSRRTLCESGTCSPGELARQYVPAGAEVLGVGSKISATRVSGFRRGTEGLRGAIRSATAETRQHVRTTAGEHAGHSSGLALRPVRYGAARHELRRALSQVRFCSALLQAVHVFRSGQPLRMHAASERAGGEKRCAQRLPIVRDASHAREGNVDPGEPASVECAGGVR